MWHEPCWGITHYTNITKNVFIDSFILMLIGLLFICLFGTSLYSDYKEWRKSENKIESFLEIIISIFSPMRLGGFLFGFILFLFNFIELILRLFVC
jgi:hypothetical protein